MIGKVRAWVTRVWGDTPERGDADPVMVLVTVVVVGLVVAGITGAIMSAHRWQGTYDQNASQQTGEDSARMAWMSDVGTSTAVKPAAKSGTTAATSVELDQVSTTSNWPAAATCRTSLWWLENATDSAGAAVVNVHRDVTYWATSSSGACVTTGSPAAKAASTVEIRNAKPGAAFQYINGNLRTLTYPNPAAPGTEACAGVAQTDTAGLTSCAPNLPAGSQRTLWEWADTEPIELLLVMTTDQSGTGSGYGTQIGWRQGAGRRELTGNASSPLTDTLLNPFAPAKPSSAPGVSVAVPDPNNPAADTVTVTRTDNRDLDGFEYQCQDRRDATVLTNDGPAVLGTSVVLPAAQTHSGHAYACEQRGWVKAVKDDASAAATVGAQFAAGTSAWSDASPWTLLRPAPSQPSGTLDAGYTMSFTWPPQEGVTRYELQYQVNGGAWQNATLSSPQATSWTTPTVQPADTYMTVQVRACNDPSLLPQPTVGGGCSPWRSTSVQRQLDTPQVSLPGGAIGQSDYTATWPDVAGFNPATNHYAVEYTSSTGGGVQSASVTSGSFTISGVGAGQAYSIRVAAVGQYTGSSSFSGWQSSIRPVAAPGAPGVSAAGGVGSIHSWVSSGVSCEAGTGTRYNWNLDGGGWNGWGSTTDVTLGVSEGSNHTVYWLADCVGASATSGDSPQASATAYASYSAPATPTLWNPTDGYPGTNITFSWTATGGYYEVVNSSWSLRGYTSGTSWTTAREAGQTCAYVRAAKNSTAASEGAWSGWSSLQCGSTLTPPTPSGSVMYVQAYCGGGFIASPGWTSSTSANYYDVVLNYYTGSYWVQDEANPVYGTSTSFDESGGMPGSANFTVRAHNSQGWSGTSSPVNQTKVGGCQ